MSRETRLLQRIALVLAASLSMSCATAELRDPCDYVYGVTFEFSVGPDAKLEHFKFHQPIDCRGEPAEPEISPAWKKTACVMFALDEPLTPTYETGEEPKMMYSFYRYESDRPDAVFRNSESGTTAENPVVYVDVGILLGTENELDAVCNPATDAYAP